MKINPNGFREYDARWLFKKDIDLEGITNLGKGLGSQIIKHTNKSNPRVIVGHDCPARVKAHPRNLFLRGLRRRHAMGTTYQRTCEAAPER